MKELIEQIKLKADSIPTNTKENRMVKGAYVDCLLMAKEASKKLISAKKKTVNTAAAPLLLESLETVTSIAIAWGKKLNIASEYVTEIMKAKEAIEKATLPK